MLGLRTTIYKVSDLQKAKDWYAKAFQTKPYFDEPFYVGFNIQGYELGLLPDASEKGDNVMSYWGVEQIQETYEHLLSLGGEIEVASVKDPWDNIIGIIYNPHFKLP